MTENDGYDILFAVNETTYAVLVDLDTQMNEQGIPFVNGLGQTPPEALRYLVSL